MDPEGFVVRKPERKKSLPT